MAVLSLLAVGGRLASAAEIHVNEGGSIQAAINDASAGDEIIVHPGTYYEAIDFLGKAIHLHSSDGQSVTTIDAAGFDTSAVTCASAEGPDTILEGFTITGGTGTEVEYERYGGGMYNNTSSPTVTSCIFSLNSANHGGGMRNSSASPTVTNCVFMNNTASGGGGSGDGGGMSNTSYSFPSITDCIFSGNTANDGGGVYNFYWCYATVTNSLFSGNSADNNGGGMYLLFDSGATVTNCTFCGNHAENDGGGMYSGINGSSTVENCILWSNTPNEIPGDTQGMTLNYCDIQGGWGGAGDHNLDADPLFASNPDPGPDGIWGTQDDEYGDLRLQAGSPCIDAGDNTAVPDGIDRDLDGNPRFVDDPDTEDSGYGTPPIVDMGAYEFQAQMPPCPADVNDDDTVDIDDLFAVLAAWGDCDACPEDIDSNGVVDIDDIFAVLGSWGPCP